MTTPNPTILIVGSLSLVAGLAWNEAFSETIKYYYPLETKSSLKARFIYAIIVTIVILLIAYLISLIQTIVAHVVEIGIAAIERAPTEIRLQNPKQAILL